jgi:hypothetical protein
VPRPLTAEEAEAARSRAGRVVGYALHAIGLVLVVVGVNWGAIQAFVGEPIRQGARDAVESQGPHDEGRPPVHQPGR